MRSYLAGGKILANIFVRLDTKNRLYGTPGGHLEYGESFDQCAQREVHEELNIWIPLDKFKYITSLNVVNKEAGTHYVNIFMGTRIT